MIARAPLASAAVLAAVALLSAPGAAASTPRTEAPVATAAERVSTQLESAPAGVGDTSKRILCERWGLFCG